MLLSVSLLQQLMFLQITYCFVHQFKPVNMFYSKTEKMNTVFYKILGEIVMKVIYKEIYLHGRWGF